MSRTSRRKGSQAIVEEPVVSLPGKTATAAYIRLSGEDELLSGINNQLALVEQYISNQEDLMLSDTYIDNGYSGTNFDRPEFNRLMTDVRNGIIQCIVVKDLSRFGRNLIETGYYIQNYFPKINVRFIAITDHFDSSRPGDLDNIATPIKLLVNEMYARDFSKKLCAVFDAKKETGDFRLKNEVYGYSRSADHRTLEIEPTGAKYVRLIFRWYLNGLSRGEIAERLRMLHVTTPRQHIALLGGRANPWKRTEWTPNSVCNILTNRIYAGDRICGKYRDRMIDTIPGRYMAPEDEWIIFENAHEPIVSKEDFSTVQAMIDAERRRGSCRKTADEKQDPFRDLIKCGECGRQMAIYNLNNGHSYYLCGKRRNSRGCGKVIHTDYLKIMVMDQIRVVVELLLDQHKFIQSLRNGTEQEQSVMLSEKKLHGYEMKMENLKNRMARLYVDFSEGVVPFEDYNAIRETYRKDELKLKEQTEQQQALVNRQRQQLEELVSVAETMEDWLKDFTFQSKLVRQLIEKIIVFQDKRIEIKFRFNDELFSVKSWFGEKL